MKRLLILFVLLLAAPAMACDWLNTFDGACREEPVQLARMNPAMLVSGGGAAPYTCATGTYMFWYDGDYSGDTDKACLTNGTASEDGSISGATVSSDYIEIQANDQYVEWANDSEVALTDSAGTVFFSIYVVDADSNSDVDTSQILEAYTNTNNYLYCSISDTTNKVYCSQRGAGGTSIAISTQATLSVGAWYRVGYSWTISGQSHAAIIASGEGAISSWAGATEEAEYTSAWTVPNFVVGEKGASGISGGVTTDYIRVKNVIITSGYKDADQLP